MKLKIRIHGGGIVLIPTIAVTWDQQLQITFFWIVLELTVYFERDPWPRAKEEEQ